MAWPMSVALPPLPAKAWVETSRERCRTAAEASLLKVFLVWCLLSLLGWGSGG